jgi:hypothetical protein
MILRNIDNLITELDTTSALLAAGGYMRGGSNGMVNSLLAGQTGRLAVKKIFKKSKKVLMKNSEVQDGIVDAATGLIGD